MNEFVELRHVTLIVLRRWWLLLILTALGGLTAYAIGQRQVKIYRATTTLLVGQTIFATELDRQDILANELVAVSYRELVRRQPVLQAAVDSLNLDRSWRSLEKQVQVDLIEGTQLIQITVEAVDPMTAQILADEVARQAVLFSPVELPGAGSEDTQRFVQKQLDNLQARIENGQDRLALLQIEMVATDSTERLSELQEEFSTLEGLITDWETNYTQLLAFLQSGQLPNKLTVIEPAQANPRPVRPQMQLFILVGSVVGAVLALGIIFLLEFLDDSLRSEAEISQEFGLPVLGSIGEVGRAEAGSIGRYVSRHPRSPIAEAFRLLRTNLEIISADQELQTILITSGDRGAGKSAISTNLAIMMAQGDKEIILMDADLRNSSIHKLLNLPNEFGLSEVLRDEGEISEALQAYNGVKGCTITGGAPPPNPSELLGSQKMAGVLSSLAEIAYVILLDAPPLIVSEALALSTKVDGVLLVARPGRTEKKLVKATLEQLDRAGANVIGVVLNGVGHQGDAYYGAYSYVAAESSEERLAAGKPAKSGGWLSDSRNFWSAVTGKFALPRPIFSASPREVDESNEHFSNQTSHQPPAESEAQLTESPVPPSEFSHSGRDQGTGARMIKDQSAGGSASNSSNDGMPGIRKRTANGPGQNQLNKNRVSCPNEACPDRGRLRSETQKNVIKAGKSKKGVQRYRCKTCGRSFSDSTAAIFLRTTSREREILETLALIAEGRRVRDLCKEKGVGEDTIGQWLREAAQNSERVNQALIDDFEVDPGQLEELWARIRSQDKPRDHR